MAELRIIDTVGRSFGLLKKDPALIVPFILPALFPIERMISNGLMLLVVLGPPGASFSAFYPSFGPLFCRRLFFRGVGIGCSYLQSNGT